MKDRTLTRRDKEDLINLMINMYEKQKPTRR